MAPIGFSEVISRYGVPDYLKVDLEHYDQQILLALQELRIVPPQLSVEAQSMSVLRTLNSLGSYSSYKLVRGKSISSRYRKTRFTGWDGHSHEYSFPWHSAGTLGQDLPGPWYSYRDILVLLKLIGPGWIGIHASGVPPTGRLSSQPLGTRVGVAALSHKLASSSLATPAMQKMLRRLIRNFIN